MTATAADGTHTTGMYSCLQDMLTLYVDIEMFDRVKYRTPFPDMILFLFIETHVTRQLQTIGAYRVTHAVADPGFPRGDAKNRGH